MDARVFHERVEGEAMLAPPTSDGGGSEKNQVESRYLACSGCEAAWQGCVRTARGAYDCFRISFGILVFIVASTGRCPLDHLG